VEDWQAFVKSKSSNLVADNFICDASGLGLILVTGDDAEEFLQNQLSNDINHIDESHHQLSAYSTPKGRMLAIFRIVRISNGYILITPHTLVQSLLQRLQMFVIQSKVTLADASAHFARFAIQFDIPDLDQHLLLGQKTGEVYQDDNLISLRLDNLGQQSRYLFLYLTLDQAKSQWETFSQLLTVSSFDAWRLSEIKSGMPVIYPETSEEFVLQMSNLDLLGGVSFTKGCYPGQEIVARMQYLGKLKRRLFLASFSTERCPTPGDEICLSGSTTADGSGKIVDAVMDKQGICTCLFIAQIKKAQTNQLRLLNQSDISLSLLELPYSIPSD